MGISQVLTSYSSPAPCLFSISHASLVCVTILCSPHQGEGQIVCMAVQKKN